MNAPFYKVYLSGDGKRDISDFISSFTYEDCLNEDSQLEIQIHTNKVYELLNNDKIDADTKLYFQFGFFGDIPSQVHIAAIKDLDCRYSSRGVTLTIRALDKGVDMKRSSSSKIWKKFTSSKIAETIAKRYNLIPVVEPTKTIFAAKAQANRSDLEFLKHLASREEDGNYITYIRNEKLYFVTRNLKQPSTITYTWEGELGNVISFTPKYRESTKNKTTSNTLLAGYDTKTKKSTENLANNKTEKGDVTLGDAKLVFNGITGTLIGRRIPVPGGKVQATNLANTYKKKADLKVLTANLQVLGNPGLEPNTIITTAGFAERHNGNWLIEKVTHSIDSGGYTCSCELVKNGKRRGTEKPKVKNTTVGPKNKKETVKLIKFNGITGKQMP